MPVKVMLAYLCHYDDRNDFFLSLLPYGLTSIAAYLQSKGISVTLANFSKDGYKNAAKIIIREKPDILGISLFSFNRIDSLKLVGMVSEKIPETVIVAGGPFATDLADDLLKRYPGITYIIKGEGEDAFYRLICSLRKNEAMEQILTGTRIRDLNGLPHASSFSGPMHGINPLHQYSFIITSRGCPHHCTYCCSPQFWGREMSFRSAENMVDEIERLYHGLGIIYFSIRDDNFTLRKDRVLEFARLLRERELYIQWNCQARVDTVDFEMLMAMKKAGLEHIQLGVESGSSRILRLMDKSISAESIIAAAEAARKAGVLLSIYLMAGMEGETGEDIQETIRLIRKIKPHDGIVSPVALYPGTALYRQMKNNGEVDDNIWFNSSESGLFVRNDDKVTQWVLMLLDTLGKVGKAARYGEKDFHAHRAAAGEECWVTEIMAGDYYLHRGGYGEAARAYDRVVTMTPQNIWGYLRLGELGLHSGDRASAIDAFTRASELVPRYSGAWFELAKLYRAKKKFSLARDCANRAFELNRFDPAVKKLADFLRRK